MATYNLIAVSGSLRKGSFNTSLLHAFAAQASALQPESMSIEILDISGLAVYNQEFDENFPPEVQALKDKVKAADAILLATPEYNRTMSSAMKNFIDWSSRPYGTAPWSGKIVYTMGATPGVLGTALAQFDLKKSLLFLGAEVIGQPEFYITSAPQKFDTEGNLIDEDTKKYIDAALMAIKARIDASK
jgi:chromate reductase